MPDLGFCRIFFGKCHGQLHQLKGANPVAGDGIDVFSATAMLSAKEFSGDHISPVGVLTVAAGRLEQQPPVTGMVRNDFFAKRIQLIEPVQLLQALPGPGEVLAHDRRVIFYFQD